MSTMIASFVTLLLAVAAMAVGVLFGRAPIRGSCGGVGGGGCAACSGRCERRAADKDDDAAEGTQAC
ncbi:MAG TPA: hypothetical protein VLS27_05055 [Gammaproteobacteria bacterium]|nr:hypothetical protein [Gammaproteobacteria bacterium]